MRGVLVRAVNEDLSDAARRVRCPVLLIYGALDNVTPPEFGARFATLMPSAELTILPNFDHLTILGPGRHQLESLIKRFLDKRQPASKPGPAP
jgi:pimeloyl-ACP methyl ester carboxylesterase